jgi:hypothetical protein
MSDGGDEASQGVLAAGSGSDRGGQAVLGGVVDHRADSPDPAGGGLELGEVGLPDPVPLGRRVVEDAPPPDRRPRLAIGAKPTAATADLAGAAPAPPSR